MAMSNSYGCRPGIMGLLAPDLKAQDPSQIAAVPSAKTGGPPITDCAGCACGCTGGCSEGSGCGCAGGKSDVLAASHRALRRNIEQSVV